MNDLVHTGFRLTRHVSRELGSPTWRKRRFCVVFSKMHKTLQAADYKGTLTLSILLCSITKVHLVCRMGAFEKSNPRSGAPKRWTMDRSPRVRGRIGIRETFNAIECFVRCRCTRCLKVGCYDGRRMRLCEVLVHWTFSTSSESQWAFRSIWTIWKQGGHKIRSRHISNVEDNSGFFWAYNRGGSKRLCCFKVQAVERIPDVQIDRQSCLFPPFCFVVSRMWDTQRYSRD